MKESQIFEGAHTFEGGTLAARYFLDMAIRPTAIICSNDIMAVGVMRILAQRNVKVPDDISVIGFDDIHLAEFANPPLTTVRMSREDLARNAFNALQLITGSEMKPPHQPIRVGTSLVVRESTGFHAAATRGLQIKRNSSQSTARKQS